MNAIDSLRSYVEGYPQGGRIERHKHDWDQLALISQSSAIIETDDVYVVHPLLKALWLPAGVHHSVYSPRPFYLHALYFAETGLSLALWRRQGRLLASVSMLAEGKEHWRDRECRRLRQRGRFQHSIQTVLWSFTFELLRKPISHVAAGLMPAPTC